MSDRLAIATYPRSIRTGVPSYAFSGMSRDHTGQELIRSMFSRSIDSIRQGSAIYKKLPSKHRPIVPESEGMEVHACFCPRGAKLQPLETWMASVSYFTPDDSSSRYGVVDRAAIILPTTFDNFGQQVDISTLMFAYLTQEMECEKVLFPTVAIEEEHTKNRANAAMSVHAVNKVHRGKVELRCGGKTLHFYKL